MRWDVEAWGDRFERIDDLGNWRQSFGNRARHGRWCHRRLAVVLGAGFVAAIVIGIAVAVAGAVVVAVAARRSL